MTNKFVQPGKVLDHTPAGALTSGKLVIIGARAGIALGDIAANATGPLQVEGVFEYAKTAGQAYAQGADLYYDSPGDKLTSTSAGNTRVGFAAVAALSGDATALVKLNA